MTKTLQEKLELLSKDTLVEILVNLSNENITTKKSITTLMAIHDPKEIYKLLNKEVTSIKNSKKFIGYYEMAPFVGKLDSILDKIDKYLSVQDSSLALKLCKRFLEIDDKLFDRVDDSNGDLGGFFSELFQVMDKAFYHSKEKPIEIAKYLYETYQADAYGNRSCLFDSFNKCLSEPVIKALEKCLPRIQTKTENPKLDRNNESYDFEFSSQQNKIIEVHKRIADIQNNVDHYIELVKSDGMSNLDILNISERLNKAFRSDEAIEWLKPIDPASYGGSGRDDLLIEAYQQEGLDHKAQEVMWDRFLRTLSATAYLKYIKRASETEKQIAKEKAIEIAMGTKRIESAFQFLHEIQEYDVIETLYFEKEKEIEDTDYHVYRKLSTDLNRNGKPLIATLLRRKLVNGILDSAQSRSYKYAASDLKLAGDFAQHIQDWGSYISHDDFKVELKEKHFRKRSFWSLIRD